MTYSPKKKISKTRTRKRTTQWIKNTARKLLERVQFQYDENKNIVGLAHFIREDGTYKGIPYIHKKEKKKEITRI